MAVTKKTITDTYTLVSSVPFTCSVKNIGGGTLLFNTVNTDDDTSLPIQRNQGPKQLVQSATVNTYARHDGKPGEDWEITVDENS